MSLVKRMVVDLSVLDVKEVDSTLAIRCGTGINRLIRAGFVRGMFSQSCSLILLRTHPSEYLVSPHLDSPL